MTSTFICSSAVRWLTPLIEVSCDQWYDGTVQLLARGHPKTFARSLIECLVAFLSRACWLNQPSTSLFNYRVGSQIVHHASCFRAICRFSDAYGSRIFLYL